MSCLDRPAVDVDEFDDEIDNWLEACVKLADELAEEEKTEEKRHVTTLERIAVAFGVDPKTVGNFNFGNEREKNLDELRLNLLRNGELDLTDGKYRAYILVTGDHVNMHYEADYIKIIDAILIKDCKSRKIVCIPLKYHVEIQIEKK